MGLLSGLPTMLSKVYAGVARACWIKPNEIIATPSTMREMGALGIASPQWHPRSAANLCCVMLPPVMPVAVSLLQQKVEKGVLHFLEK
jgi:hypothetical protein